MTFHPTDYTISLWTISNQIRTTNIAMYTLIFWQGSLRIPSSWFVTSCSDNVIYIRYIIPQVRVGTSSKVILFPWQKIAVIPWQQPFSQVSQSLSVVFDHPLHQVRVKFLWPLPLPWFNWEAARGAMHFMSTLASIYPLYFLQVARRCGWDIS